jgi:drug/metabolite transporter (DMT)-like permease
LGLRDLPPISFAALRFLIAAVTLLIVLLSRKRPLPRDLSVWVFISLTGVMIFTLNYGLVFWAGQFIPSGQTSVLQATVPLRNIYCSFLLTD